MISQDRVDSFGIALPPDWVRFPLEEGNFEAFVRGQRDRLRREVTLSRTAERQFEVLMRGLRNDCESSGIRMVATLLGVVGSEAESDDDFASSNDEDEGDSELVAASMTIAVLTQSDIGSDIPLTVNTIQAAMNLEDRPEAGDDAEDVVISNLEPPSIVTMPVGEVVKLIRHHRLKYRENRGRSNLPRELSIFVQHFFVPIDELGSSAAMVTFTSPIVALARPMSELFDAMMETFEMFSGDDITDPGSTARDVSQ